jgi:hypothetical protein
MQFGATVRHPPVAASSSSAAASFLCAHPAAASSHATAAKLKHRQQRLQQLVDSMELATLMLSQRNVQLKCRAIAQAVVDDAARHKDCPTQSSFNLNQAVEGSGWLLMAFFGAMAETNLQGHELNSDIEYSSYMQAPGQAKRDARSALATAVPRICELIRSSFDVSIQHDGWNALGALASKVVPYGDDDPCFQLSSALLDRGCDANARNADNGMTPLMAWLAVPNIDVAATGVLQVLERGADLDAHDSQDWTALHWMAAFAKGTVLKELIRGGWLSEATLELPNNDGLTALQIAQNSLVRVVEPHSVEAMQHVPVRRREVCDLLRGMAQMQAEARPMKLKLLTEILGVTDLAHMVMGFIDGKERAQ